MNKVTTITCIASVLACCTFVAGMPNFLDAEVLLQDTFNRTSFDAKEHGWAVQTHPQGKGQFGRMPSMVGDDQQSRYSIKVDSAGAIAQTSSRSQLTYSKPVENTKDYLEFAASLRLSSKVVKTDGLLFAISAFGQDSKGQDAVNIEFVTKQINDGTNSVPYDQVLVSAYDNYAKNSGDESGKWVDYVETQHRADSSKFVTYSMRLYSDRVEYTANGVVFATYTGPNIPDGKLKFVLTAWTPDETWQTAEASLPNDSFHYMDVDWAKVTYVHGD
ncbi:MAG: hypothetical protein ABJZ55_18760 [Fuerstiella sp.]